MNKYLIELNEKDLHLLNKCIGLSVEEMEKGARDNETIGFIFDELKVDMLKLRSKIYDQVERG